MLRNRGPHNNAKCPFYRGRRFTGGAQLPHYSSNGREITYEQSAGSFWSNIFLMTADGTRQQPLLPPKPGLVIRAYPRFSSDGSRILYADETYKKRVEHDAKGQTIFLDVMSSELKILHRHSNTNEHIKLPKGWRPGVACWMQNGNEILFAADDIGLITKEHGTYDLRVIQLYNFSFYEVNCEFRF